MLKLNNLLYVVSALLLNMIILRNVSQNVLYAVDKKYPTFFMWSFAPLQNEIEHLYVNNAQVFFRPQAICFLTLFQESNLL